MAFRQFKNPPRNLVQFSLRNQRFVFVSSNAAFAMPDDESNNQAEQEEAEQQAEQQQAEEERRERRQRQASQIEQASLSQRTKRLMRESLASDNTERQNLVDEVLNGQKTEAEFLRRIDVIETQDASWEHIFTTQRGIRKKIQQLQWKTESYLQLTRNKTKYEPLIKNIRKLNRDDDMHDRELRKELFALTISASPPGPNQILQPNEAREMYEIDPLRDEVGFRRIMNKYKPRIETLPKGNRLFKRLETFKNYERDIERRFQTLEDELVKIIQQSIDKINKKKEKERIKKILSASTGIRIQDGVEIEFDDPGNLVLPPGVTTIKIARVDFDDVSIYDSEGRHIDTRLGIPHIELSNGARMTPARFKKWSDGANAREKINTVQEVEVATGLSLFSLKIHKGMELSYPRKKRNERGETIDEPQAVRIQDINEATREITFSAPVFFQPGLHESDPDEMRTRMNFGEFVKWWHRYEVEKSVGLHELQQLLKQYNDIDNQMHGIEPAENLPILVEKNEKLRSTELEKDFVIKNIEADGVVLENGEKFSFPAFFYWVKNFDVMKVSGGEGSHAGAGAAGGLAGTGAGGGADDAHGAEAGGDHGAGEHGKDGHGEDAHKRPPPEEEVITDDRGFFGKIADVWYKTTLLSFKDIWTIGHEVKEFIKRRHERRSKGRVGLVGKRLPGLMGSEFERIYRSSESEEVSKFKEALEKEDIDRVKHMLYRTTNIDVAKACIMTLTHKGEMRWDDHHLYGTLNKLTARHTLRGAELFIPHHIPRGKTGEDMARDAIDALWGKGIASEWFMENTSKYNSHKKEFEYKFKQLENDPKGIGGPIGECKMMLAKWRRGEYVNPMEFEAMIDGAFKWGKMTAETKMFFIIAGVLYRQGDKEDGETLLSFDRIGELDSLYSNIFPLIDFFTQKYIYDENMWDATKGKWGKSRKLKLEDLRDYAELYFPNDFKNGEPQEEFSRFMWEIMEMDHSVRVRMDKGIRNAENMDHDDAHFIIPLAIPKQIIEFTGSPTGGQKKFFTDRGYMNAYVGFNQYIITLAHLIQDLKKKEQGFIEKERHATTPEQKQDAQEKLAEHRDLLKAKRNALRDVINSFIQYDAILSNIYKKAGSDASRFARLDKSHYESVSVVDSSNTVGVYQKQMRNLVSEIGDLYLKNDPNFGPDAIRSLYETKPTGSMLDKEEKKNQLDFELKLEKAFTQLSNKMQDEEADKAIDIIMKRFERSRPYEKDKEAEKNQPDALRLIPDCPRPRPEEIEKLEKEYEERKKKRGGGH